MVSWEYLKQCGMRAETGLAAYRRAREKVKGYYVFSEEQYVAAFLKDLLHYCDQRKINFSEELKVARHVHRNQKFRGPKKKENEDE